MDLGLFLLQIATQAPQLAQNAAQLVGPTVDISTHGATAIPIVKPLADILKGRWGGSIAIDPPTWFVPAVSFALAIPVGTIILIWQGVDLTLIRNQAAVLMIAGTVALGNLGMNYVHNQNSLPPRVAVQNAMAALPPLPQHTGVACCDCGHCTVLTGVPRGDLPSTAPVLLDKAELPIAVGPTLPVPPVPNVSNMPPPMRR